MFELVNKARKHDKGFTLVELIVVILIIAIIAVALAPQVIKYVNKSRVNVDTNNAATIKSSVQTAYADYLSNGGTALTADYTVTVSGGTTISDNTNADLSKQIGDVVGTFPATKSVTSGQWKITIAKDTNNVTVELVDSKGASLTNKITA